MPLSQEMASVLIKKQTSMRFSLKLFLPMLVCRNYTTFCRQTNLVYSTLVLTLTRSSSTSKRLFHEKRSNTCKLFSAPKFSSILWKTKRTIKPIKVKSTLWVISRWDHKPPFTNSAETHEPERRSKLQRMINENVLLFCYKDWFAAEPCKIWCSRVKRSVLIWSPSYVQLKNGEPNLSFLKKKSYSKTTRRELWTA
jgi:hypothetical protein